VKQVLQDRSGGTVVRDVPAPPCPPGSLLVRNAFSAISSGTERARVTMSKKSLLAKARERPDLVREVIDRARTEGIGATRAAVKRKLEEAEPVGYSSAGEVLEVGEAAAGFDVGDLVACAGGGHANHAEIVAVPVNLCAKVPPNVSLEAASLTTIASIALHGIRLADVAIGDRVAVVGCGLVGQIAVRILVASGAEVIAVDADPARARRASEAGAALGLSLADDVAGLVHAFTGGRGVDAGLITAASNSNAPLVLAAELARDRGALVVVGDVLTELPRALLYDKELSLRVSRSYGPGRYDRAYEEQGLDYPIGYVRWTEQRNMEAVLALQSAGRLQLADLVDEVEPVAAAAAAYERLAGPLEQRPQGAILLAYGSPAPPAREPFALPEPTVETTRKTGRSAPVRVGLVGAGSFASRVLVPAFVRAGARLEVVGGGAGPSAEAATRSLGFARVADSAEALVTDDDVDVVVVATRHASHADLVARALEAGKHVFCEKPLALTSEELDRVLVAAEGGSGILAVGFNRRFSPLLVQLRDFLSAGAGRRTASYRVSAGRLDETHWTHQLDEGGGRILGEGCHFVDCLRFVVGSRIDTVYAAGYSSQELALQARDNVVVHLTFADGSVGAIVYSADGAPKLPKERLEAFSGPRTGVLDDYRSLELLGPGPAREAVRSQSQDKGHQPEVEAFLRGVETGEPPVPLQELANVSLATLAIVESLRTGRPVQLTR
jgi:predicted dehydrogenase